MANEDEDDQDFEGIEEIIKKFDEDANGEKQFFSGEEIEALFDYYMTYGEFEIAGKVADRGLELFPENGQIMIDSATVKFYTGDLTQALSLLDRAKLYEPQNQDVYTLEGDIYEKLNQLEKALYCYRKAMQLDDGTSEIYMNISHVLIRMGKYNVAIDILKDAYSYQPENEIILGEILACYVAWGKKEDAVGFLENIINEKPYSYSAWYHLGKLRQFDGDNYGALEAYEYATLSNENFSSAYFSKGAVLETLNNFEKAIENYQKCNEIDENDSYVSLCIGRCFVSMGKYEDARDNLKKATKQDELFADAWYLIGVSHMAESNFSKAIPYIKKAKSIDLREMQYNLALAACYTEVNNMDEAGVLYRDSKKEKELYDNYWLEWVIVFYRVREQEYFSEILQTAKDSKRYDTELLTIRAIEAFDLGQIKKGSEFLEAALKKDYKLSVKTLQKINPGLENQTEVRYLLDIFIDEENKNDKSGDI
ncbi:MAG: tetratricopeptide repeat protein [Bacteroidia bacterium]|nr:tetratricopeptide repeat protein [Bacteroidia bacterium]